MPVDAHVRRLLPLDGLLAPPRGVGDLALRHASLNGGDHPAWTSVGRYTGAMFRSLALTNRPRRGPISP
jgi:hypothetical protein